MVDKAVVWSVFVAVLAAICWVLLRLAARVRRRGAGRDLMGPIDLLYRPHTHEINVAMRTQEERMVESPSPGEPPRHL
jgi:hypothetical protein